MEFSNTFLKAFELLMEDEGGFVNDPVDPGGATKFGITQKTYEAFVGRLVLISDMKELTLDVAKQIYFKNYWQPLSCEYIDKPAVAICIFNTGVLYGLQVAGKIAQQAVILCGANIKIDSMIGGDTTKVLNLVREKDFLKHFHKLLLERIEVVILNNAKLAKYRKGWQNRTHKLLALADISGTIKV